MPDPRQNPGKYPSCQGIGQRPLSDFPSAWLAISCCGPEDLILAEKLLKAQPKRTVAETIENLKCARCGKPPQAAYLQQHPYRKDSIYHNPAIPTWACQIQGQTE